MDQSKNERYNHRMKSDDDALIHWLADRDVPCPLCNYNLRALTTPRCPECGNDLRLSVISTDRSAKPWITLAVAVCGSAGMGFIFSCIVLKEGLHDGPLIDAPLVFFILTIPGPIILLRTRRRYQRLSRKSQWTISLLAAAIVIAVTITLCIGIGIE
jgi:hypothetical protein